MKISYNWLKQFVKIDWDAVQVGDLLTDLGLEVEGIESFESIPGGLKGLVVGEVKTCQQHPNADRLKITTVDVGEKEWLPIVCGAPNVAKGQKVIVALVGTTLYPTSGEPFTIKKSKIRGGVGYQKRVIRKLHSINNKANPHRTNNLKCSSYVVYVNSSTSVASSLLISS